MENYIFKNVSFSYPKQEQSVLKELSFSVEQGEFLVICGPSGCGKSTLLRHFKTCLKPHGVLSGEILFEGKPLDDVDDRTQAQKIGFVLQSPENQVVTDKVWHELAFGLENLGYDTPTIRRRVAEVSAFFGIEKWFYKNVSELSGGQKQLLSLASIMAMQPKVLVLDEPTAQLDPIVATEFLALLGRINRELGTTIILTEHRLEEAFVYASRVIVIEKGEIICDDIPKRVGLTLKEKENSMFLAMPTAMRIWAEVDTNLSCPLTIRDGRDFLTSRNKEKPLKKLYLKDDSVKSDDVALSVDNIWFRYEKDSPDVLKGFSINLKRGEFYAILGGNGAGKTTALKVISNILPAYRGDVKVDGKLALLPQNPQTIFVKNTVREDLYEVLQGSKMTNKEKDEQISRVVNLCELSSFIDRHPFDISGGEQQRTALAKVLLTAPNILLLDEPTKGFDAEFKVSFANILKKLLKQGVTILMVSHDLSFCAEYCHCCGMFFDGNIVAEGTPREFFSGNSFYTTPANRMAQHIIPKAVTVNDVVYCCGTEIETENLDDDTITPLPEIQKRSVDFKSKPIPLWRKITACISVLVAFAVFICATGIIDFSLFINSSAIGQQNFDNMKLYIVLLVALTVFIFSISRRRESPVVVQADKLHRNLNKRTVMASALILLFIPLTILCGVFYLDNDYYNIIALLVLLECMLPFILVFEGRKPKARELVTIAVLCAIGIAGRSLFFMLPQFKPVLALTIITGVALGGEAGFLVGAVTMLTSNMLFSQGPWTPWQMFAMGITGFLAGVLFKKGLLSSTRGSLAVFGALCAVVVYGGITNSASAFMFSPQSLSFDMLFAYYVSGLPMDLIHGFSTALFLLLVAEPMLEKLDRIKMKYGLIE